MTAYLRLTAAAAALSLLLAAGCQSSAPQDEALPDQSMQGSSQPAKEPAQPPSLTANFQLGIKKPHRYAV